MASEPATQHEDERPTTVAWVGPLGEVDDDRITVLPHQDRSYAVIIARRDVVSLDAVPASGTCRVVVWSDAMVEERWTVSVIKTAGQCHVLGRRPEGTDDGRAAPDADGPRRSSIPGPPRRPPTTEDG